MATLITRNRKLEQTLFNLGVSWLSCDKDEEGMTYWTYSNTEKTQQIFEWFKDAAAKRRKEEW